MNQNEDTTAPVMGIGMVVPGGSKEKKKLYEGDVVEHGVIVKGVNTPVAEMWGCLWSWPRLQDNMRRRREGEKGERGQLGPAWISQCSDGRRRGRGWENAGSRLIS